MNLTNNTVLITGGSSGLGLELARQLTDKGNKVLICGRSAERLEQATALIPQLHTLACDIATDTGRRDLAAWITQHHPDCNILINNAAIVHKTSFADDADMVEKATLEIQTNLLAPIALSKLLLPVLEANPSPAIINITTGLALVPRVVYPVYNATKAGLRSFTQVLREQLKPTGVQAVEVLMTVVDTPWHKGEPPKMAITPRAAIDEMVRKLEKGQQEIKIGKVAMLALLNRLAPALAFRMINRVA